MAIGNNDNAIYDELEDEDLNNNIDQLDNKDLNFNVDEIESNQHTEEDFISSLLKSRGIEDKTKIKFEDDEGELEEVNWDTLSTDDKLNILENSKSSNYDLDNSEIDLINAIRRSNMTPAEYLRFLELNSINNYITNSTAPNYLVDSYSDEELFVADLMSRMGNITPEEAQETLEKAMSNESLFKKLISAIRNEYKKIEEENAAQEQLLYEQQAQEDYNNFTNAVIDQINNFTEVQGYDLNLDLDDMEQLLEFITGYDAAGNNHFAKALSDPNILVETAWFALNGKQMILDITNYFLKEITKVRKESYKKGQEDAKSHVVFKEQNNKSQNYLYSDLDEF